MRCRSFAPVLLVAGLAAACSGGAPDDPAPSPTSGTSAGTSTAAPTEDPPFDCAAVGTAQQDLGDSAAAELERLGIDRSAPEAFTVVLLATSQNAATYWGAVEGATTATAPEGLRADVAAVAAYWTALEEPLAAIELTDSSAAAVQAAQDELGSISQTQPDDELVPAQQRVQDELGATCGLDPQAAPSSSE